MTGHCSKPSKAIATGAVLSRPVPAELGVEGFVFRYRRHFVYWKTLSDGAIGIVTVLHERMHRAESAFGKTASRKPPAARQRLMRIRRSSGSAASATAV